MGISAGFSRAGREASRKCGGLLTCSSALNLCRKSGAAKTSMRPEGKPESLGLQLESPLPSGYCW